MRQIGQVSLTLVRALLIAAGLVVSPLAAAQSPDSTTIVVPVVGNVAGLSARWVTSFAMRNDTGQDVDVWLLLPTTAEAQAFSMTLRPGQTATMPDVIAEAFGTETALSPLKIITSGRRSVTVAATVYALGASGEITASEPIPIEYGAAFFPLRALPNLSFSDDFRTNVGLVNLSEGRDASFTLALRRINGGDIAVSHITLPPVTLVHTSIQSLFPSITKGDDFTVLVETAQPETYVYASVIQNATSSARFVSPTIGTSLTGAPP